jgi:type IV fimbrial biogenesis protein FimT
MTTAERGFLAQPPERGFTLIELIIAVALVAVLAALALPSYREFSTRMTVSDNTNTLIGALNAARSEAVKRGRTAAVVALGDDWSRGWQVVVARESAPGIIEPEPESPGATAASCSAYLDNAVVATSTVPLCLLHRDALPDGYRIAGLADGGAENGKVVFTATGALRGARAFDFSVCRPADRADPTQSRRIHVGGSGSIESHRDTTGAPAGSCS